MTTLATIALVLAAVLPLAYTALAATKRAGEQKTRADVGDVNLSAMSARHTELIKSNEEQKNRADRLSKAYANLLSEVAKRSAVGSYQWLLQLIAEGQATAAGDSAGSLPTPSGANAGLDTELLRPGSDG